MEPSDSLVGVSSKTSYPIPLILVNENNWSQWRKQASPAANTWIDSVQFLPKPSEVCLMPGENGALENVVVGVNNTTDLWTLAHLPYRLPQGVYVLENDHDCGVRGGLPLGWALGAYNYTRYQKVKRDPAQLLVTDESVLTESQRLAAATFLVRDLINTPSNDMGPVELSEIAEQVAAVGEHHFPLFWAMIC